MKQIRICRFKIIIASGIRKRKTKIYRKKSLRFIQYSCLPFLRHRNVAFQIYTQLITRVRIVHEHKYAHISMRVSLYQMGNSSPFRKEERANSFAQLALTVIPPLSSYLIDV